MVGTGGVYVEFLFRNCYGNLKKKKKGVLDPQETHRLLLKPMISL